MKRQPFTLSTDGSNDRGGSKLFPLVIRTVDENEEVRSDVLTVPACYGSATGENIFQLIEKELSCHDIPWENCISFGSDNANVMVGQKKGVYGFLLQKHPQMFLSGCVCHLIHIAAEKGAACLPLNIEQLLVDVYYYLDKSSKRQGLLRDIQLLHDIKQKKILKHVATRWLSIGQCLPRLLENWDALLEFFKEQEASATTTNEKEKTAKLRAIFKSPTNRLYCKFLLDAVKPFEEINTSLQTDRPMVQELQSKLQHLFSDLLLKFVNPAAMKGVPPADVDFASPGNICQGTALNIGDEASNFIQRKAEVHLRDERVAEFYSAVQKFYVASCTYIRKKLPLDDELLQHAKVADPKRQDDADFASVSYFIQRFPCIKPADVENSVIQTEFKKYQLTDVSSIVKNIQEGGTGRVDNAWRDIGQLKKDGKHLFRHLPSVMLSILTIPHSSAHCERIFSIVRKNQTDFRGSLGSDTLEALVVCKARNGGALERSYSSSQLADLKSSTYRQLQ